MKTPERLAQALRELDLFEMADKAEKGYYDDFLSELDTPIMQLVRDLTNVGTKEALALAERTKRGEFDATKEEADEWADSDEGRAMFGKLLDPK